MVRVTAAKTSGKEAEEWVDTHVNELPRNAPDFLDAHKVEVEYLPPKPGYEELIDAPPFVDWHMAFPFLQVVLDHKAEILEEMKNATNWAAWPEHALYHVSKGDDWKVFPICYSFPAHDPEATRWVNGNAKQCPKTCGLLASIPGMRTALFSRLGPGTSLEAHRGWAQLANHVMRVHLPLVVPGKQLCGLTVNNVTRYHDEHELLCFDDSQLHMAFNLHESASRVVLIFDIARPKVLPAGTAEAGTTLELEGFIREMGSA